MTTKKTYEKPSLQVVMLQDSDLIATSGDLQSVTLGINLDDTEEEGYAD